MNYLSFIVFWTLLSLAGCGGSDPQPPTEPETKSEIQPIPEKEEPTEPSTQEPKTSEPSTDVNKPVVPQLPITKPPETEPPLASQDIFGLWEVQDESKDSVEFIVEFAEATYRVYQFDEFNHCYVHKEYPVSYSSNAYIVALPNDVRGEDLSSYPYIVNYQLDGQLMTVPSIDDTAADETLKKIDSVSLTSCYDASTLGTLKIEISFAELEPLIQLATLDKALFRISVAFDTNDNKQVDKADIAAHLLSSLDTNLLALFTPIKEDNSTVPTFIDAEQHNNTLTLTLPLAIHPALSNITNDTGLSVYAFYTNGEASGNDALPDATVFTSDSDTLLLTDGLDDVNGDYDAGVDITQVKILISE